ncbi:MAG TPA: RNA polymerase sigma-70 factor [Chitinophagaceae bacterium]|nr:RNA polymerase sigma-70 factor [Chitinophagaceae bacterium]
MHGSDLHSDQQLFARIATGDESAFREIFTKFTPRLFPFVRDIVKSEDIAREIVQEVFLRLWLKRETIVEIESPSSWLYRVASNISLTHFRRQKLEEKIVQKIGNSQQAIVENDDDFSFKELNNLIQKAAQTLSTQRLRIFKMSRELGLSRKEIANELGISENTVKNQLATALKQIRDFIQKTTGIYIPAILIFQALSS